MPIALLDERDKAELQGQIEELERKILTEIEIAGDIVQTTGDGETVAMSQKAVTNEFGKISKEFEYTKEVVDEFPAEMTVGYINPGNGLVDTASTGYVTTQHIPVKTGDVVVGRNTSGVAQTFTFVAAFKDGVVVPSAGSSWIEVTDFTVPEGVDSIRISYVYRRGVVTLVRRRNENAVVRHINKPALGYMTATAEHLSDGETISLPYHNVKNHNVLAFSANISSFEKIVIGKQEDAYITIDNTSVTVTAYGTVQRTYQHGLTIAENIQILMKNESTSKSKLSLVGLCSCGNEFSITDNATFLMDKGCPFVTSYGSELYDCVFSWTSKHINKPIWLFGDSFFSFSEERWTYYLARDGFDESCMINGYAGEGSADAFFGLENLLNVRVPQMVVWCIGMNEPDTETSANAGWENYYNKLVMLSKTYGFELVLYTTPTTTKMNNNFKNEIVRSSGYRYVDADKALNPNGTGEWLTGTLAGDNVHPTMQGAKVLYYKFITDLPELTAK